MAGNSRVFFGGLGNLAYRTAIFVAINGDYSLVNGGFIPAIALRAPVIYTLLKNYGKIIFFCLPSLQQ
jgi:hypothetical protein